MLDKWNELNRLEINIGTYFQIKNKKKLLLIGDGTNLEHLQNELDAANIQYTLDGADVDTDIVVVIDSVQYIELEKHIAQKRCVEIISLEELVTKVYNNRKEIL